MALTTIVTPGPSGTPVSLTDFGIPVANNINELITELTPVLSPWTAYTPTWTTATTPPTLGASTIAGRYVRLGEVGLLNFYFRFDTGGGGAVGTGEFRFSLPPGWTSATVTPLIGQVASMMVRTSGGAMTASTAMFNSGATYFRGMSHLTAPAEIQAGVPFVWTTGANIQMTAMIELAP